MGYSSWGCKESDTTERLHSLNQVQACILSRWSQHQAALSRLLVWSLKISLTEGMMDRMYILKTKERVRSTQVQFASQPDVTFSRWPPPMVLNESAKWVPLCAWLLSCFSRVRLFVTLWTAAHQTSLSMGLSRKEHWSGLPYSPPGDLPGPGTEPASPAAQQAGYLLLSHWGSLNPFIHSVISIFPEGVECS